MDQPRVTYYALLTDAGRPAGLVRRIHLAPYPRDESLRRNLTWRPTEYLRRYAMGHNDTEYAEISEQEAEALIEQWRLKWSKEDKNSGPP
jgi:hypothetical protein